MHTVLVVDDDEELREILRDALEAEGFAIVAAAEGRQALAAMAKLDDLCVVILDLLMPGMNGWDFYDAMKANAQYSAVPVVVVTSAPSEAPKGVARVMRKPLKLERVLSTIREYCAP